MVGLRADRTAETSRLFRPSAKEPGTRRHVDRCGKQRRIIESEQKLRRETRILRCRFPESTRCPDNDPAKNRPIRRMHVIASLRLVRKYGQSIRVQESGAGCRRWRRRPRCLSIDTTQAASFPIRRTYPFGPLNTPSVTPARGPRAGNRLRRHRRVQPAVARWRSPSTEIFHLGVGNRRRLPPPAPPVEHNPVSRRSRSTT